MKKETMIWQTISMTIAGMVSRKDLPETKEEFTDKVVNSATGILDYSKEDILHVLQTKNCTEFAEVMSKIYVPKIRIPDNARQLAVTLYTSPEKKKIKSIHYVVAIDSDDEFEAFCQENNIGYHEGARRDITKSSGHVFTKNKNIFENFNPTK